MNQLINQLLTIILFIFIFNEIWSIFYPIWDLVLRRMIATIDGRLRPHAKLESAKPPVVNLRVLDH